MEELETQTRQVLAGQEVEPAEFAHPIAFNLFSHDSAVGPEGYCEEELKMVRETRKMFHDDALADLGHDHSRARAAGAFRGDQRGVCRTLSGR